MSEAIEWLKGRLVLGSHLGLARIERLLELLGNPQDQLKLIHVAGTNGKGSTSTYITDMLIASGQKVGAFITPYIEAYEDQIQINHQAISQEALTHILEEIQPLVKEMDQDDHVANITEFEIITAVMLYYFAQEKVDFAVIEVGIGGTLDSTNIIRPLISVITTISYDHTAILGHTLGEIAANKAGIIKAGVPVVTSKFPSQARQVVEEKAKNEGAPWYELTRDFTHDHEKVRQDGSRFDYTFGSWTLKDVEISLVGDYQIDNASLALTVLCWLMDEGYLPKQTKGLYQGAAVANIVGRMEVVSTAPYIMVDGAHNPQGIQALDRYIQTQLVGKSIHLIFSAITTKDIDCMLDELLECQEIDSITLTTFSHDKAMTADMLHSLEINHQEKNKVRVVEDYQEALDQVMKEQDGLDMVMVTGSLYFISAVRKYLQKVQ